MILHITITEPWENEMRVVVLARKNVAAMKTGARHLLRSVGVLSPSTGTQFFPSAFANGVEGAGPLTCKLGTFLL